MSEMSSQLWTYCHTIVRDASSLSKAQGAQEAPCTGVLGLESGSMDTSGSWALLSLPGWSQQPLSSEAGLAVVLQQPRTQMVP